MKYPIDSIPLRIFPYLDFQNGESVGVFVASARSGSTMGTDGRIGTDARIKVFADAEAARAYVAELPQTCRKYVFVD